MKKFNEAVSELSDGLFNIVTMAISGAVIGFGINFLVCVFSTSFYIMWWLIILSAILGGIAGIVQTVRDSKKMSDAIKRSEIQNLNKIVNNKIEVMIKMTPSQRNWREICDDISSGNATVANKERLDVFLANEINDIVSLIKDQGASCRDNIMSSLSQFTTVDKFASEAMLWTKTIKKLPNEATAIKTIFPQNGDIQSFHSELKNDSDAQLISLLNVDIVQLYSKTGLEFLSSYFALADKIHVDKLPNALWEAALENSSTYSKVIKLYNLYYSLNAGTSARADKILGSDALLTEAYKNETSEDALKEMLGKWLSRFCNVKNEEDVKALMAAFDAFKLNAYVEKAIAFAHACGINVDEYTQNHPAKIKTAKKNTLDKVQKCNFSSLNWNKQQAEHYFLRAVNENISTNNLLTFSLFPFECSIVGLSFEWDNAEMKDYINDKIFELYRDDLKVELHQIKSYDNPNDIREHIVITVHNHEITTLGEEIVFLVHGETSNNRLNVQTYVAIFPSLIDPDTTILYKQYEAISSRFVQLKENRNSQQKIQIDLLVGVIKDVMKKIVVDNPDDIY